MRKLTTMLLCCVIAIGQLWAQSRTVTGKVTDADGKPLENVNVTVKGTTTGTITDEAGNFSLSVPENARQIEFSIVGFGSQTVNIRQGSVYNMSLTPADAGELNEVVVTGYTTIQKKKFSGAIGNVNAAEVRKQPMASFDQALQGAAAGVASVANSGQPGSNAIVRIRGNGSISGGNVPLYIMDGIEINAADFSALNQGDFERVEILKDAVATGMYGSRGANGVIVITTRKGRSGQLTLNYDAQVGFSDLPEDRLVVMNSSQKIDYEMQRGNPYGWTQAEQDSLRRVNFNWRDPLFQQGVTQIHQLSASGGSATSRFYASLSYMDQEGIVQTTALKRYTARINVDNNIKNWRFGINLQGGYSRISATSEGNTFLNAPLNAIRWANPYERDRDPVTGEYQETGGVGSLTSGQNNPAMELFERYNFNHQIKGVATSYLEFHFPFLKGLYARTNWGIDFVSNEFEVYGSNQLAGGVARQGSLGRDYNRSLRYIGTTSINYKTTFGANDMHEIEAGVFSEAVKRTFRGFGFTGYGLTNGLTNEAGITAGSVANPNFIPAVNGSGTENGLLSYFSIINYGYAGKYYLSLVGRRDGSSRFGLNNQFANFGSVGLTWVASDEKFLSGVKFLDDLRVRATYGTNGNNNTSTGDFGQIPQLGRVNYAGINGFAPGNPGNLSLRWETNRSINFGVDFAMFNRRVSGTVDVYDRETQNLFYQQPASLTTGFGSVPGNDGTLRNRGIEFMLRGDVIRTRNFRWTVEGNITYNDNRVLALPEDSVIGGVGILAIGKPLGSLYLVEYAGVNQANGNALYYTTNDRGERDVTQTYSVNDRRIWGTSVSPLFGGITTTFAYKGLELSAQMVYFLQRDVFNNDRVNLTNPTYYFDNMHVEVLKEWQRPGDVTDVPRPTSAGGNAFQSATTRFLEDGSYWRLRNITLSYTIPSVILTKARIKSARIFMQGQNWFTATKFKSFDPEQFGTSLTGAQYPALVQTTFGISLGF